VIAFLNSGVAAATAASLPAARASPIRRCRGRVSTCGKIFDAMLFKASSQCDGGAHVRHVRGRAMAFGLGQNPLS